MFVCSGWIGLKESIFLLRWTKSRKVRTKKDESYMVLMVSLNFELCFYELFPLCESELMVFGLLSLLMGHWIAFVAKICVKPSALMSSRFYPCSPNKYAEQQALERHAVVFRSDHFNSSISRFLVEDLNHNFCPEVVFLISKF